jgi:hypothetical protein
MLAAGAAAVLVLVVAIVWALSSGGEQSSAPPVDQDEQGSELGDEGEAVADDSSSPSAGPGVPATGPSAPTGKRSGAANRAVDELNTLLRGARLWSTVAIDQADPSVVIIQSSLCDDDNLSRVVTEALSELKSHGIATVRCVAPHGSVIFEKTL